VGKQSLMELLYKDESYKIVGACMEIHRILSFGLSEIVYKDALEHEFQQLKIPYAREKIYSVEYKGIILPHPFYADFVVYDKIILEIKAVSAITNLHMAQTINYVKLAKGRLGIIANFGLPSMEYKRVVV
jgi:GxxExxY protein